MRQRNICFLHACIFLFLECTFVTVTNPLADTIHAATILNCASVSIVQTEYWNMLKNNSGYWHKENDIKSYLTLELNGSVLVSLWFLFLISK